MSWDVVLDSAGATMGTKEQVRECFLSACERIAGIEIPRRGPTEIAVDPTFSYEVYFSGHKRAIDSLTLGIRINDGDPQADEAHPIWLFLRSVHEATGWRVTDTHTGRAIDLAVSDPT